MEQLTYKRIRPFLFAGLIIGSVFLFGIWAYKDFTTPPDVMQPDFTASHISSKKKTDQEKAAYTTPPTHPKNLIIDKLKINANVIPLGTLKNGAIDTPKTAWDVGWYASSSLPGTPGAVVLDGHVNDTLYTPGIFYDLRMLRPGDTMQIQRGDNNMFTYTVRKIEQIPSANLDMKKALAPLDTSKEGLNIITCGGAYDKNAQTYTDRVVVYAVRS